MPPKNKKQAQQQAKRLQEQRKRKEQQQALLQLERKKYAGQIIETGLFLPASNQLIIDFPNKKIDFITQKLMQTIKTAHSNLTDEGFLKNSLIKELHYYIKDSRKIFKLQKIKNIQGNQKFILKARVFVGIMMKIMLNQSPFIQGSGKNKSNDQLNFKQLLTSHSVNKLPQKKKIFETKEQIQALLNYTMKTYFSHFLLLYNYKSFDKRVDRKQYTIYMTIPGIYSNNKETSWTDLSKKQELIKIQGQQKKQNNQQSA